jgi:hypothetical protein
MFMSIICGMLPNEVVMSGPEKLKSMLGSTLAEVDTKELDRGYDWSGMLFPANDVAGPGEGMPWGC